MSLWIALAFFITHIIWLKLAPPLLEPLIKIQNDEKEKQRRANNMALQMYSAAVYILLLSGAIQL